MLVYKSYNRFYLVCSCEDNVKNRYLTEKRKLGKKKQKKISTNVLIVSAVPPQVYNIIK